MDNKIRILYRMLQHIIRYIWIYVLFPFLKICLCSRPVVLNKGRILEFPKRGEGCAILQFSGNFVSKESEGCQNPAAHRGT